MLGKHAMKLALRIICVCLLALLTVEEGLEIATPTWRWKWAANDSDACRDCSFGKDRICSTEVGAFEQTEYLPPNITSENVCIHFDPGRKIITADEVMDFLGPNGVIAFVGDSNMRNLYLSAMEYFGNGDWFPELDRKSQNWTTADRRHRIDHTYLCPKSFGRTNITVAFLWMPFIHRQTFFSRRLWSGCGGRHGQCASVLGIPNCDQSSAEGVADRWECDDWIDEVQLPYIKPRKFVVVSHGGIHDVLHTYKANIHHSDLNHTASRIHDFYSGLKTNLRQELSKSGNQKRDSYCWSAYGHGGAEVMISPLHFGRSKYVRDPQLRDKINAALHMFIEEFYDHKLEEEFDGHIDAYELAKEEWKAPFSNGDGIHYPPIFYRALLELVLEQVMKAEYRS